MKTFIGLAVLFAAPTLAQAQEEGDRERRIREVRREYEQAMRALEERFAREREALRKRFEDHVAELEKAERPRPERRARPVPRPPQPPRPAPARELQEQLRRLGQAVERLQNDLNTLRRELHRRGPVRRPEFDREREGGERRRDPDRPREGERERPLREEPERRREGDREEPRRERERDPE